MKRTFCIIVILLFITDIFAQIETSNVISIDKVGNNLFKKLHFSHSYSVNFINNSIGGSGLFGTYIGNMDFNLRKNLKVNISVGIMNNFYSSRNRFGNKSTTFFIPDLNVVYKPFKNFTIRFHFSQMPYNYFYSDRYMYYDRPFMW